MTKNGYTHVSIIADRSGSMQTIKDDMNGGIRSFLQDQAAQPGTLTISVMRFDSALDRYQWFATAEEVLASGDIIEPRGSTALLDAIGVEVTDLGSHLALMAEDERPEKVIVVVVTDGMENASREWSETGVKSLVSEQTDKYGWDFVFLGANMDAVNVAGNFGFRKGSTITYAATAGGAESVLRGMSGYVSKSRSGVAAEFSDEDRASAVKSE